MGRYCAFISYRHTPRDQKISEFIRKGLENFQLPKDSVLPKKRRAFRDTDELPTSSDLGADIENALRESDWLIALCSPEYIESRWCMREIRLFIEMGRRDRILPVLVAGTPETAVPPEIRDLPLAGDLRDAAERSLRRATEPVVFSLLGKIAETEPEAIAQAERRRRILTGSLAFAAAVAVVFGFAVYAARSANRIADNNEEIKTATLEAEAARTEAINERNDALLKSSAYYGQKAWEAIRAGDNPEAISLAVTGLPEDLDSGIPYDDEAMNALRTALSFPADPSYQYTLIDTLQVDFRITGWISTYDDGMYLKDETYYSEQNTYPAWKTPYHLSVSDHRIKKTGNLPQTRTFEYTLNGEPFYADHVFSLESYNNREDCIAWLENPLEGQEPHTAVISAGKTEAVELKTDGNPVSFGGASSNSVTLVDQGGKLRRFSLLTGEAQQVADGEYRYIYWSGISGAWLAVTRDGQLVLLDTFDFSVLRKAEETSAVRSALPCPVRNSILACCADGFRVYDMDDLHLLTEVITEDEPLDAVWGSFDDDLFRHDGNSVIVLYDQKVELYKLEFTEDSSPLYRALVREGTRSRYKDAVFSNDGSRVYLEQRNGDISAWDTATGKLIWYNRSEYDRGLDDNSFDLSADGKAIWRIRHEKDGYDRIDIETGKTVYTIRANIDAYYINPPDENGDGSLALVRDRKSKDVILIRTSDGEKIMTIESAAYYTFFSPDGKKIRAVDITDDAATGRTVYRYAEWDPETKGRTEWKTLFSTVSEGHFSIYPFPDGTCFVSMGSEGEYSFVGEQCRIIRVVEIPSGTIRGEYRITGSDTSVSVPWDGGLVFEWKEGETQYYCRIGEDGSLGEKVSTDSAEGRSLATNVKMHMRLGTEDGYRYDGWTLWKVGESVWHYTVLRRFLDDAILLEKEHEETISMSTSANGQYLCIYGDYYTPLLVRNVGPEELLKLGREMAEGRN